jgi:hypothetical protein
MDVPAGRETDVSSALEALILDLLEWIGPAPRDYSEVIDAWRTSCPHLPVWEEANARGFIVRQHTQGARAMVAVTALGIDFLRQQRPPVSAARTDTKE